MESLGGVLNEAGRVMVAIDFWAAFSVACLIGLLVCLVLIIRRK